MIDRTAEWVAAAAGGRLVAGDPRAAGPRRAVADSREVGPGDLFVGLPGTRADGGSFGPDALAAGAWGVLVRPEHASADPPAGAVVIATEHPLAALGRLARAWRRSLGAATVGITGSTGKTSTKDILAALLGNHLRTNASRENFNTEIGLPLSILEAPPDTEALVLELAMRGQGQIAELTAIAEPDVAVVVNVGPVHLELLGTVEHVAAAKAELIRGLHPGATCVVPAHEPLLAPHLRDDVETVTFGPGGEVELVEQADDGHVVIDARGERVALELPYRQPHNLLNTLAAVAAAHAVGVTPSGQIEVSFSPLRGQEVEVAEGVTAVNDCYNANPMSMRAALDHLAAVPARRRIAVLGTMAELGSEAPRYHAEVGKRAEEAGIDVLVAVGEEARAYLDAFHGPERHGVASPEEASALLERLAQPGDRVLVKGSRSAGLERVVGDRR